MSRAPRKNKTNISSAVATVQPQGGAVGRANQPEKPWYKQPKITEWITALTAPIGLLIVFQSGLFDAKKAETSAQNERLTIEKINLENRKEKLADEIAKNNKELEDTKARLLPLEKERDAILRIFEMKNSLNENSNFFDISISLSDTAFGWHLVVMPWHSANTDQKPSTLEMLPKLLMAGSEITRLHNITIINVYISNESIKEINKSHNLTNLNLINCGLNDEIASKLLFSKNVVSLNFSHNNLTKIPTAVGIECVSNLFLQSNPITDKGLLSINNIVPNVNSLDLSESQISSESCKSLSGLTKLTHLDVRKTHIDGKELLRLCDPPVLNSIQIENEKITPETFREMKRNKPSLYLGSALPTAPPEPHPTTPAQGQKQER